MSKPIDPNSALETIWKLGPEHARAKGELTYLDEFTKSLRAELMKEAAGSSVAAKEMEAMAHKTYRDHIKGLGAATEREQSLRWKIVAAQAAIEIWRSQSANNRTMDRSAA